MPNSRRALTEPLALAALGVVAIAAFALTSRYPGYIHHDTAEVAMWSTLGWPLGLPKHPPLMPWLFRAYSNLVPLNWATISILSALNISVGAIAVWAIARLVLDGRRAALAALLYCASPAGTFLALKFNHNAILVSLWPLTILAFLLTLRAETAVRSAAWGVLFGACASAALLAKYYSGVLLACCFLAALASPLRDRFFRQPGGYVAVLVFALLIAPHAGWMIGNRGETLSYALNESEKQHFPLLAFLMVAPTYLAPPLIGFWLLRWFMSREAAPGVPTSFAVPARLPHRRELMVLAIAPFALSALLIAAFKLRGAASWTLPDFSVVPVLLAARLPRPSDRAHDELRRFTVGAAVLVALLGPVILVGVFAAGDRNMVEPRVEFAQAAERIWRQAKGRPVPLVAGDPQSATTAALVMAGRPPTFPGLNYAFAPWVDPERVARDGLVVLCRPSYKGCGEMVLAFARDRRAFGCQIAGQRRLWGLTGPLMTADVTIILPADVGRDPTAEHAACQAGGDGARALPAKTTNSP